MLSLRLKVTPLGSASILAGAQYTYGHLYSLLIQHNAAP